MGLGDAPGDGQPQSIAPLGAIPGGIRPVEPLKQVGQVFRRDRCAGGLVGQQQRVAIARAIAARSPVLMADEPTGALDSKTGAQVLALMREMNRMGTTVILITHDTGIAAQAHRTVRVMDGKIVHDSLWDGVLMDINAPAMGVTP